VPSVQNRSRASVPRIVQRYELAEHFSTPQIIDLCLNVGLSQITNRFNATFLPDVDEAFTTSNEEAYAGMGGPPVEYPPKPAE
jgi:hypothetical protein